MKNQASQKKFLKCTQFLNDDNFYQKGRNQDYLPPCYSRLCAICLCEGTTSRGHWHMIEQSQTWTPQKTKKKTAKSSSVRRINASNLNHGSPEILHDQISLLVWSDITVCCCSSHQKSHCNSLYLASVFWYVLFSSLEFTYTLMRAWFDSRAGLSGRKMYFQRMSVK